MSDPKGMPRSSQGGLNDLSMLHLPRRTKRGGKGSKRFATIEQVRSLIRGPVPRMKYVDTPVTANVDFTGADYLIGVVAQASTPTALERLGLATRVHKIELRGSFGSASTGGDTFNTGRLIVGQWYKDPGNSYSGIDSVLDPTILSTTQAPYSPYNWINGLQAGANFKVLYDVNLVVGPGGPAAAMYSVSIPLDMRMSYTSAGTAIVDIEANMLFIAVVSDSGAAPHPNFNFVARTWWTEEP